MPDEVISPEAAAMRSELDKMLYGLDSDISGFEKKLTIAEGARTAYADAKAAVAAAQADVAHLDAFGLEALSNSITVALGSVSDQANKVKSSGVLGALEVIGLKGADQKLRDKAGDILWRVGNVATKLGQWFNRARKLSRGAGAAMIETLRQELEQMARVEASWQAGEGAFEAAWKESEEAAGFKVGDPARTDAHNAARKAAGGDRWDAAAAAVRVTDPEKYLKDRNKRLGAWVSALQKRMNDQLRGLGELRKMVTELQGWGAWVEAQKKKAAAPAVKVGGAFRVVRMHPFGVR